MTEQQEKKPHKHYKRRGHGEGSVFELKGSKRRKPWVAQITLENGEKKQTYHGTQKEAVAALRKKLNEHEQGILATGPQQKLKDYLAYWLEEVHKDSLRLSTYARYRILVYTHIIPVLGHIPVQKLTPQQVQSLYAQELKDGKATGSVRLMHTVLHLALENAVRWGLVPRNVCDLVDPPRPAPQEAQILTLEQAH